MAIPRRPQILVVDDDPSLREALATALGMEYAVHTAATGAEACRILRDHSIALTILDAILGDEHGLDLVPALRALSPAPVVLFTGHSTKDLAIRAVRAQVTDYLEKPVDLIALRAMMERVLGPLRPDPAVRARAWLDEHCGKPLRLSALAGQLGLSERHLCRVFRAAFGQTPLQYLAECRLERARHRLRETDSSIKRIAAESGYPNLLGFRRAFRRRFGMPPAACRAAVRK